MAASGDVRDILDLETPENVVTKDSLFNENKNKKKPKKTDVNFKRPDGMHRELWGLLWTDNRYRHDRDAPPLIPTDTNMAGYKQMKAKIGRSKVRPWKWMPFTNPARKDGAIFYHWRRTADEGKDYPFARFNKTVDIPSFSDMEYQQLLHDENWSRAETDHLFELAKRFDLRFIVIKDRWDEERFPNRSVEDLKERYYSISNSLAKNRAPAGTAPKIRQFDAEHERRRKEQLIKLFHRTEEEVDEEQNLITELKKIETRKKEREKKTLDLQKLISQADTNADKRGDRKATKKKVQQTQKNKDGTTKINPDSTGIKFPDFKGSGCTMRSQRMKLPAIGQKKTKAIEQVLGELGIEINPIPSEDIVTNFNELRQDIVLLYELKLALANCEFELQTLRHQYETLAPGKLPDLGSALANALLSATPSTPSLLAPDTPATPGSSAPTPATPTSSAPTPALLPISEVAIKEETPEVKTERKPSTETIDVVGNPVTPNRKRRAALEQGNIMKKIKQKI